MMSAIDYEAEYNNRRRVPEHAQFAARWQAASAEYRARRTGEMDIPYGPGERQRYDYFPAGANAALVVYIHGGYWQRGDRKDYSFLAAALNSKGISVALPSYTLCPDGSVAAIIEEMRLFLTELWRKAKSRLLVTGHSAGGHLTGAMLATDWSKVAGAPADLVGAGCAISGVFDVAPLVGTSLNDALGLDAKTARAVSPLSWPPPRSGRLLAAVGGLESAEFLRQSRDIAAAWSGAGLSADVFVVPGTNHFSVVDELADPASPLFARVEKLASEMPASRIISA